MLLLSGANGGTRFFAPERDEQSHKVKHLNTFSPIFIVIGSKWKWETGFEIEVWRSVPFGDLRRDSLTERTFTPLRRFSRRVLLSSFKVVHLKVYLWIASMQPVPTTLSVKKHRATDKSCYDSSGGFNFAARTIALGKRAPVCWNATQLFRKILTQFDLELNVASLSAGIPA